MGAWSFRIQLLSDKVDYVVVESEGSLTNGGFATLEDEGILMATGHAGCWNDRQGKYWDGARTHHSGSVAVSMTERYRARSDPRH